MRWAVFKIAGPTRRVGAKLLRGEDRHGADRARSVGLVSNRDECGVAILHAVGYGLKLLEEEPATTRRAIC